MKMLCIINTILILSIAMLAESAHAFDAPPPPDRKTLEWTVAQAQYVYPIFDVSDTKAAWILEQLDSSMNTPGFYLDIDKSEVDALLGKKITFKVEKITWLNVLARVADEIEADIVISQGVFKLVSRKPIDSTEQKNDNKTSHHNPLPAPSLISPSDYNPQSVSKPRSR